jgi:hypothetical protein
MILFLIHFLVSPTKKVLNMKENNGSEIDENIIKNVRKTKND